MQNKNLVRLFSITEMILLLIASVLSNKISDLLEINHTVLWIATLVVIIALVLITWFKTKSTKSIDSKSSINLRISKNVVKRVILGMVYIPPALMFSGGAFQLARMIDHDWLGILSGAAVSATILFGPSLMEDAKKQGLLTWPYAVGFILSVTYGVSGYYLVLSPDVFKTHLTFYIIISVLTLVSLKYVYLYYTFITTIDEWYEQLPDS